MEEVCKLNPFDEIPWTHIENTDVIELDVPWKGSEIINNLNKIKNIPYANLYLYYSPFEEIKIAVKNHDFFQAYSMGDTLFESQEDVITITKSSIHMFVPMIGLLFLLFGFPIILHNEEDKKLKTGLNIKRLIVKLLIKNLKIKSVISVIYLLTDYFKCVYHLFE